MGQKESKSLEGRKAKLFQRQAPVEDSKTKKLQKFEDILTWPDYFISYEEELTKESTDLNSVEEPSGILRRYNTDEEINEKVSLYEDDMTSLGTDEIVCSTHERLVAGTGRQLPLRYMSMRLTKREKTSWGVPSSLPMGRGGENRGDGRMAVATASEENRSYKTDEAINKKVSLYEGDMMRLVIDAVVCSTHERLRTRSGLAGAIEKVGGPRYKEELGTLGRCEIGEAKIVTGHNLPSKYVILTVGPTDEDPSMLERCYRSCLEQAKHNKLKSLAFCCIATGLRGYPKKKAAIVALQTVRQWLEDEQTNGKEEGFDRIVFCLYTEEDVSLYEKWMQVIYPCPITPQTGEDGKELLRPLPGLIEITTTIPDMLGYDDSPRLAKMPCGHVIGPESLTAYCRDLLDRGEHKIQCPDGGNPPCNYRWEYSAVRHVARLTPEELEKFDKIVSENYLKRASGIQRCPGCKMWCFRTEKTGKRVLCMICTKANGRNYYFCWHCLSEWKSGKNRNNCGNPQCLVNGDRRIEILAKCTRKLIFLKFCPAMRGCPNCGLLIEHRDKCAHVVCSGCQQGFCFVCLQAKKGEKWPCNPLSTCKLAPLQTRLSGTEC